MFIIIIITVKCAQCVCVVG